MSPRPTEKFPAASRCGLGDFARIDIGPQFVARDCRQALDLENALNGQSAGGLPLPNCLVADLAGLGEIGDAARRINRFLDGIHGAQSTTNSCN